MNTLKAIFNIVELKKLLTKRNIIVFITFGALLIFFLHIDMNNHKSIFNKKSVFKEIHQEKVNQYVFYSQYGGHGITIMLIPSPLSVLNSKSILNESLSSINTGEKLNIFKPIEYEDIFVENVGYKGFIGIFLIFSVLFGLISGYEITNNPDYFKFTSKTNPFLKIFSVSIISKMLLLIYAFIVLFCICLLWAIINGINLFNIFLLPIFLVISLTTFFFLGVGVFIGSIIKNNSIKIGTLAVLYAVSILLIPLLVIESNRLFANDVKSFSEVELANLKDFMEIERQGFKEIGIHNVDGKKAPPEVLKIIEEALNNKLKTIRKREQFRKEKILKNIKVTHSLLSLFPVTFYISVNKEISGCGALVFIDFFSFSQKTKNDFIIFIIKEKFYNKAKPGHVKPFTKNGENKNIFFAKSHLPFNFWLGVFLTLFYAVVLLFVSYKIQKKRQKIPEPTKAYQIEKDEKEKDKPLFVLCKNDSIKQDIFNYYQKQKASVCLEKINTGDFMFNGIKAYEILKHLCQVKGVDEQKALENLKIMGIKDLSGLPVCHEIILKIYAAVITAADFESIVIDDLLKNESRELENDFIRFLLVLEKSGKKILYLSTQIYQIRRGVNNLDEKIDVDKFESLPIDDLDRISFR